MVEETKAARKLQEEIARIRALHSQRSLRAFNFASHRGCSSRFKKGAPVEDIVIRRKNSKKKGSAIIVMGSKDQVDAATRSPRGDVSNPLLVLTFLPSATNSGYEPENKQAEIIINTELNNIFGAGYHAYEDTVLKKLQK
ncbi:hypothetical protein KI387_041717, partial [Taxus chinensis]